MIENGYELFWAFFCGWRASGLVCVVAVVDGDGEFDRAAFFDDSAGSVAAGGGGGEVGAIGAAG